MTYSDPTTRHRQRASRDVALEELARDMASVERFSAHLLGRPLRGYQRQVAQAVTDSVRRDLGLTFVCMMARQAGKNETAAHIEAFLMNLHRRRGGQIVKASPTFKPQTINSILRLQSLVEASCLPSCESRHGYMLAMGSARCAFFSAAPGASVVGATADLLLEADEAQDVDPVKWNKDFRPMGASTNVTSVMWGTAWTEDTLLARTARRLRELERQDGIQRVFMVPWQRVAEEVPAYGQYVRSEIQRLGPGHPLVRTQYFLEEIGSEAGMFPTSLCTLMQGDHERQREPHEGATYVMTLDVGGASEEHAPQRMLRELEPRRDATALTICQVETTDLGLPRFLVRDRYYWLGTSHASLHGALVELARRWQPRALVVDATGVGAGLTSFLQATLKAMVVPFVFTQKSKSELGWDYMALCGSGRFLDHAQDGSGEQRQFWREVRAADYEVSEGPGRNMRWGVADPTVHDDLLISAALCAALGDDIRPRSTTSYVVEAEDVLG